jgi:pentatricopeptide repeat protein
MAFTALIKSLLKDGSVVRITALFRSAMSKKLAKAASEC